LKELFLSKKTVWMILLKITFESGTFQVCMMFDLYDF
jgi:hypothetical protein